MKKLARHNRDKVVALLGERLAFEQSIVKLYDVVLHKMRDSSDPMSRRLYAPLEDFRAHEKEHEHWLDEQIRALTPVTTTVSDIAPVRMVAELVDRVTATLQARGSGGGVVPLVQSLLTAELLDNSGWEILLELADDAEDDVARREFRKRLHQEEEHLSELRRAFLSIMRREVLTPATLSVPAAE